MSRDIQIYCRVYYFCFCKILFKSCKHNKIQKIIAGVCFHVRVTKISLTETIYYLLKINYSYIGLTRSSGIFPNNDFLYYRISSLQVLRQILYVARITY